MSTNDNLELAWTLVAIFSRMAEHRIPVPSSSRFVHAMVRALQRETVDWDPAEVPKPIRSADFSLESTGIVSPDVDLAMDNLYRLGVISFNELGRPPLRFDDDFVKARIDRIKSSYQRFFAVVPPVARRVLESVEQ